MMRIFLSDRPWIASYSIMEMLISDYFFRFMFFFFIWL